MNRKRLESLGLTHEPTIAEVQDLAEVIKPPVIYGLRENLASCWIAYLESSTRMLISSRIVLVSKETGQVVHFGSARDEG
jgi:hypothetical protein